MTSHIRPEDILPDESNTTEINGLTIRKGTIAAALANAAVIDSEEASEQEKQHAFAFIKELAPSLIAIGLNQHMSWRNPDIQKIIDNAAKQTSN